MSKNIHEYFGTWSLDRGIEDKRTTRIISRRRRNLQRHTLPASMVILNNDSLSHLTDYR